MSFIKQSTWELLVKLFHNCRHITDVLAHSYTKLMQPNWGVLKFLHPQQQLPWVPFHMPLALTTYMMAAPNSSSQPHSSFPQGLLCPLLSFAHTHTGREVQTGNTGNSSPVGMAQEEEKSSHNLISELRSLSFPVDPEIGKLWNRTQVTCIWIPDLQQLWRRHDASSHKVLE